MCDLALSNLHIRCWTFVAGKEREKKPLVELVSTYSIDYLLPWRMRAGAHFFFISFRVVFRSLYIMLCMIIFFYLFFCNLTLSLSTVKYVCLINMEYVLIKTQSKIICEDVTGMVFELYS